MIILILIMKIILPNIASNRERYFGVTGSLNLYARRTQTPMDNFLLAFVTFPSIIISISIGM